MSALPLDRFPVLRSAGLDRTREVIYRHVPRHPIVPARPGDRLEAHLNGRRLDRIAAGYLTFGGEVRTHPGELDFYLLQVVLAGSYAVRIGDREVMADPGEAIVLSPGDHVSTWWSAECGVLSFKVSAEDYRAHLAGLLGRAPAHDLRFEPVMDVRDGLGRDLNLGIVCPLTQRLNHLFGVVGDPVRARQVENTLLTGLLRAQPNTYSAALDPSA